MIGLDVIVDWPTKIDPDAVARLAALLLDTAGSTLTEVPAVPMPPVLSSGEQDAAVGGESC